MIGKLSRQYHHDCKGLIKMKGAKGATLFTTSYMSRLLESLADSNVPTDDPVFNAIYDFQGEYGMQTGNYMTQVDVDLCSLVLMAGQLMAFAEHSRDTDRNRALACLRQLYEDAEYLLEFAEGAVIKVDVSRCLYAGLKALLDNYAALDKDMTKIEREFRTIYVLMAQEKAVWDLRFLYQVSGLAKAALDQLEGTT